MSKIEKLTPAQQARFGEWAQRYIQIGMSTEPADFERANAAALKAYENANLKKPMVVLRVGSPYACAVGGAFAFCMLQQLKKGDPKVGDQVGDQVRDQVGAQVWDQVGDQVGDQVRAQVGAQVRDQVWAQVWAQVRAQVWAQVGAQVGDQVWAQVGDQVRAQVGAQVRDQVWAQVGTLARDGIYNQLGGSLYDAQWCAYVTFMRDVVGATIDSKFDTYDELHKSCGWVWWHQNVLAVSDRPVVINRDERGRLHCEDGPSIAYRDGWKLYHVHGVLMPADVIEHPKSVTVDRIQNEANAEVRRVMIERYGTSRYLLDSGAKQLQSDDYGILYRKDMQDDEPLVMVRVLNSTPEPDGELSREQAVEVFGESAVQTRLNTMESIGVKVDDAPRFKTYFLRVPPDTRTAHEGVAWSFDRTPKTYAPSIET